MNKQIYITLWITVQTFLFILPILIAAISIPYTISYDEGYVREVIPRILDDPQEPIPSDFEGAVEDWKDAESTFYKRQWKLENKELYYLEGFGCALLLSSLLQFFNLFWFLGFDY